MLFFAKCLGNTGLTIPKGMVVVIPIHALHHNPDYFLEPQQFNPERFMGQNKQRIKPYTYLPFSAGPRNCVGLRFALMETKSAIIRLVTKFKFIKTPYTKIPLEFNKISIVLQAKNITIGVQKRI